MLARALAIALVALTGCYAPALRDCTVSCASQDDCAAGQTCGGAGLCVAHDLAAACAAPASDAGPRGGAVDAADARDARDAAVAIDAPPPDAAVPDLITLDVAVAGKGSVVVDGVGTCSSLDPQRGSCSYRVPRGVGLVAHAVSIQPGQVFQAWTSTVCAGQAATCSFTPTGAAALAARFGHS